MRFSDKIIFKVQISKQKITTQIRTYILQVVRITSYVQYARIMYFYCQSVVITRILEYAPFLSQNKT